MAYALGLFVLITRQPKGTELPAGWHCIILWAASLRATAPTLAVSARVNQRWPAAGLGAAVRSISAANSILSQLLQPCSHLGSGHLPVPVQNQSLSLEKGNKETEMEKERDGAPLSNAARIACLLSRSGGLVGRP